MKKGVRLKKRGTKERDDPSKMKKMVIIKIMFKGNEGSPV